MNNESLQTGHLQVVKHPTHDRAVAAAATAAGTHAGQVLTGILFRQGARLLITIAAPLAWLATRVSDATPTPTSSGKGNVVTPSASSSIC